MGPRRQEFRVGHGIVAPAPGSSAPRQTPQVPEIALTGRAAGFVTVAVPSYSLDSNPFAVSVTCISICKPRSAFS